MTTRTEAAARAAEAHPTPIGLSATALAARIASGELSAVEAVEAHIARIERVNPKLNAVVVKRYEAARAEAEAADRRRAAGEPLGPLHGVPITVKECLDFAGMPSTFGLDSQAHALAQADEMHVARLRRAGAIVLGKTNVSQLLLFYETDNPVYGRTNNPWDLERAPGGSSGGEAAIIAAGGSPLGIGADIGGSIRIPAAFCGLASLKPTAGRLPDRGRHSVPIGEQAIESQIGLIARTVRDVALALEVANGGRAPQPPGYALGDDGAVALEDLRVGFFTDDGIFPASPAPQRAVHEAAAHLAAAGAKVTQWSPYRLKDAFEIFFSILSADGARGIKRTLGKNRRDPRIADMEAGASAPRALGPLLRALLRAMRRPSIATIARNYAHRTTDEYWRLVERQIDYRHAFAQALDEAAGGPLDVVLLPAASLPAFRHGAARELATAGVYATLLNVLGFPAGVVPVTRVQPGEDRARPPARDRMVDAARATELGSAGLPIGVQVVARPWREDIALAAMAAIEIAARERPGFPLTPVAGGL